MEPYLYTGNNPIMFTDPTGMSAEQGGDGWWSKIANKTKSLLGMNQGQPATSPIDDTVLDEVVVSANRKSNWFQRNFSSDKLSNDWTNIKEKSGLNHFKNKSKKAYDHIQNVGGLVIYGKSSYNMGGYNIKGNPTVLNYDDIGLFTGGGASLSKTNSFFKGLDKVQTAVGGFLGSFFLTERIENNSATGSGTSNSDSIYTVSGTIPGYGIRLQETSTNANAKKLKSKYESEGVKYISITGKQKNK